MDNQEQTAYQEKMDAKLTQLKADIQKLEGELKDQKADARLGMQEELQQLRRRRESVKAKLLELKTASGAAWGEAKGGVASAWHDLEAAFHKASAEFKRER